MNSLKERLEQYEKQPDERVWDHISKTMDLKARRHRMATAGAVVAILAVAAVATTLLLQRPTETPSTDKGTLTAQTETQTMRNQTADINVPTIDDTKTVTENSPAPTATEPTVTEPTTVTETPVTNTVAKESEPTATVATTPKTTVRHEEPTVTPKQEQTMERTLPSATVKEKANEPKAQASKPAATSQKRTKAGTDSLVVWIPNAFSPDDPTSDDVRVFKVFPNSTANIISYEIYIYSRTGRQVYHSRDINAGWDGTAKGHAQPMGTYVYVIEINDAVKGLQHKKGTVTLIR